MIDLVADLNILGIYKVYLLIKVYFFGKKNYDTMEITEWISKYKGEINNESN